MSLQSQRPFLQRRLPRAVLLATFATVLALGGLHFGSPAGVTSAAPALAAVATAPASPAATESRQSAWPRAALRVWLLIPQLLPTHDR
jgi:hypothetical protein